ncbi:MAG: hypothetical protein GY950_16845 [bacterium]|nr:hypothetical protein [bacterium]
MLKKQLLILILLISMGICFPLFSAGVSPEVTNNDFEALNAQGFPSQWDVEGETGKAGITVTADSGNFHSGKQSLFISHDNRGQSSVISQSLHLKVGHLYRLSGWLKTQSAHTDPIHRYPTPAAACITMESFPFTNHSPSMGGTSAGWQKIETLFIATRSRDRVRLHLGFNGSAKGKAWFDDIRVEKVEDISTYIPMETVKWFGPAFRYDDRGWIFVHIEGKPYQRGYQYGYLLAEEIVSYIKKLGYENNHDKPEDGWQQLRYFTDSLMLRKYDEEYLEEMKGIADGAAKNGAEYDGEPLDFLDIVTLNSAIDIDQMISGLRRTSHALSGRSFMAAEEELNIPYKEHKCSGFLANGPATPDGGIVFGQIFMWGGYTGVHWNVFCDVVPDKGHRLVYETYPGGIHSGADFYLNAAGIMMGETTVMQTPFDMDGTPQSNRIRKAAQYASSIDEAVKILSHKNNGMYTNDWLMGDAKTNETAIFLLGTKKSKLWRSSSGKFPGGTTGFFWSNNNNKDDEVRKEYIPNADNAPYDLIFSPWNRDLAFNEFFKKYNGKIDAIAGVNLWASSPINRAHACDGKIITTEMAKEMVFLAHFGKVTLREKFPNIKTRLLRDYPGATPHLSLGYSLVSPKFVTEKLKALKKKKQEKTVSSGSPKNDISEVKEIYGFDSRSLWHNTVYPASSKENWFVSATAVAWRLLKNLPSDEEKAVTYLGDELVKLNYRYLYTISREGAIAPLEVRRVYDRYNHYRVPRARGTILLHQLRLKLGNGIFSKVMNRVHDRFKEKPMTNRQFISIAEKAAKKSLKSFIMQWLERADLPQPKPFAEISGKAGEWEIALRVKQPKDGFYRFLTTVAIETEKSKKWRKIEITQPEQLFTFRVKEKPTALYFNSGNDIPVSRKNFYTFGNFIDDFHHTLMVYGTSRQIEANHTLALRYQTVLADAYVEILPPLRKDSEITEKELGSSDLIVLGGTADNGLMGIMAEKLGLELGKNYFRWQGKTYGDSDDGLFVVFPNPFNREKVVYLVIGNSALELYEITKKFQRIPAWVVFKGSKMVKKGYHQVEEFKIGF